MNIEQRSLRALLQRQVDLGEARAAANPQQRRMIDEVLGGAE